MSSSPVGIQSRGNRDAGDLTDELVELGPWFHNLHLPGGVQTAPDHPLGDFPRFKWETLAPELPDDLSGARCLDIGCNAGFYTFELAKRGADVLGIDVDAHYLNQAHWASRRLGLDDRVELRQMQVYELSQMHERFDVVLFLGVFYHLRYPLLALDIVADHTIDTLVFQSLSVPGEAVEENTWNLSLMERDRMRADGWPKMAFIESEFCEDPTNWWVPNRACTEAMLRSAGFDPGVRPDPEMYVCKRDEELMERSSRNPAELAAALGRPSSIDWKDWSAGTTE